MPYDEQEIRRSKVVSETPSARREVTQTERSYAPASDGPSTAAITALVILAVAVIGLLGLLFWNMQQSNNNANLAAQQPTPQTIIQQPAQQPPVIVQQPAPASQPAPIIVNPPAAGGGVPVSDDGKVQAAVDKKLTDDATLSTLGITASVSNGRVLLVGSVKSDQLKNQVEKAVLAIKGVKSVDNQITVSSS
jgi:hypothetical protein